MRRFRSPTEALRFDLTEDQATGFTPRVINLRV